MTRFDDIEHIFDSCDYNLATLPRIALVFTKSLHFVLVMDSSLIMSSVVVIVLKSRPFS